MNNNFMKTYWSHPERFFGFWKGKLMMKAQPRGAYYPTDQLVHFLESFPPPTSDSTQISSSPPSPTSDEEGNRVNC